MNIRIRSRIAALGAVALLCALTPAVRAADLADVGYVDQAALSALPVFGRANKALDSYGTNLRKQYIGRARNASQSEQQRLAGEYQSKMADRQRQLFAPIFQKAQIAIASIASSKNLSAVIDKRIVIFGGVDITNNVRDLMTGVGDPVPPVNTPPPSSVGYVDQSQIDGLPKIKSATDEFAKFKADQDKATQAKLKSAKTDADRNAILKDYQKTLTDKQATVIKPVVDKTRDAMSDVARKRGLALVVDRGNIIYGGTDITADVATALK